MVSERKTTQIIQKTTIAYVLQNICIKFNFGRTISNGHYKKRRENVRHRKGGPASYCCPDTHIAYTYHVWKEKKPDSYISASKGAFAAILVNELDPSKDE
jgi:hypothetical protein